MKKETESLILAAQEQALRTNSIKHSIDKASETPLCGLCGNSTETVRYIISGYKRLAQREYNKHHDKVPPPPPGGLPYITDVDARRNFQKQPLKVTILGVAPANFFPHRSGHY